MIEVEQQYRGERIDRRVKPGEESTVGKGQSYVVLYVCEKGCWHEHRWMKLVQDSAVDEAAPAHACAVLPSLA